MRRRATRFEVDRAEGKLLGVCAGLANRTGLDVTDPTPGNVSLIAESDFPELDPSLQVNLVWSGPGRVERERIPPIPAEIAANRFRNMIA